MINETNYEEYLGRIANILEFFADHYEMAFCLEYLKDIIKKNRFIGSLRDMAKQIDKDLGCKNKQISIVYTRDKDKVDEGENLLQKYRGIL